MKNEQWYKDIPLCEFGETFREIAEIVSLEKAMELYERFDKTVVQFSNAPLYNAKRYWIRANQHMYKPKYMARKLGVSDSFVRRALQRSKRLNRPETPDLFDGMSE